VLRGTAEKENWTGYYGSWPSALPAIPPSVLVNDFQAELNDARFKGARNAAAATRRPAKGTSEPARGQVQVSVVERVIHFRAELNLETSRGVSKFLLSAKSVA
jgi:hypothetical protein